MDTGSGRGTCSWERQRLFDQNIGFYREEWGHTRNKIPALYMAQTQSWQSHTLGGISGEVLSVVLETLCELWIRFSRKGHTCGKLQLGGPHLEHHRSFLPWKFPRRETFWEVREMVALFYFFISPSMIRMAIREMKFLTSWSLSENMSHNMMTNRA